MNLAVISVLLQELLFDNQRITLPGVGTFLLEEIPASFLEESNIMLPPTKKIVFDGKQAKNDGLLENAYARKTGLVLEDSKRDLLFLSKKVKEAISNDLKVVIPGFGTLYNNKGDISFEKDRDFDVSPESFGLDVITIEQPEIPTVQPYADSQVPVEFDLSNLELNIEPEVKEQTEDIPQLSNVVEETDSSLELENNEQQLEQVAIVAEKSENNTPETVAQEAEPTIVSQVQEEPKVCDELQKGNKKERTINVVMKLLVALVVILLIILLLVIFKDSIASLLKHILYSKEELEIMEKWATL